jgi:hypothetical protein
MPEQADSHPGAGRPQLDRDEQAVVIGGSVARDLRGVVEKFEQVAVVGSQLTHQPPRRCCVAPTRAC